MQIAEIHAQYMNYTHYISLLQHIQFTQMKYIQDGYKEFMNIDFSNLLQHLQTTAKERCATGNTGKNSICNAKILHLFTLRRTYCIFSYSGSSLDSSAVTGWNSVKGIITL